MIAPIDKLKSFLSDDIVSLFGDDLINDCYVEAYKATINIINDDSVMEALASSSLLATSLYTSHTSLVDSESTFSLGDYVKDRRILKVYRHNSDGTDFDGAFHVCYKENYSVGFSGLTNHEGSIHYANDRWNPVYHINTVGGIEISPKDLDGIGEDPPKVRPKGRVWFLTYPTFESVPVNDFTYTFSLTGRNFSTISASQEEIILYGLPTGTKDLLYIQIALDLCQSFLANFVHDEEDTELVGLIKEHVVALTGKKNEQLNIILPKYGNMKQGKSK